MACTPPVRMMAAMATEELKGFNLQPVFCRQKFFPVGHGKLVGDEVVFLFG